MSKEDRTKIHDTVKKAFGESIVGSTVTENDKKFVVFDKYRKGGKFYREVRTQITSDRYCMSIIMSISNLLMLMECSGLVVLLLL